MAERDPKTGRFPQGRGAGKGPGTGDGWGGPAKGASASRITPNAIGEAVRALGRDPEHMAAKAAVSAEMLAVQMHVARSGENESARIIAADKVLDRLNGRAVQHTDVTTKGERIGYVVAAPDEDESAEAWQQRQESPVLQ